MKARRDALWIGASLIILLTISACGTRQPTAMPTARPEPTATEQPTAVPTETAVSIPDEQPVEDESPVAPLPTPDTGAATSMAGSWAADGVITDREYTEQSDFGDIRLWWRNDAEYLYLAIEGDTAG